MKRSHAVEILRNRLEVILDIDFVSKATAEAVLKTIEDMRMLPPHSDVVFQKNCKVLQEPHGNEWDQEDA
jgi:hypothetical protein